MNGHVNGTNIAGKVVVITGASSGLGEATARHLAARGAIVVLGARRAERIAGARGRDLTSTAAEALALATDVTDAAQVQRLVDAAVEAFGRVDVMINNAGLMPQSPLERRKIDDWDRMIDVNIKGVLYGIAAALPHMQRQKSRPHHQRLVGRRPQGRSGAARSTRRRRRGAGALRGAAPGGEALQHPHHDHLAGRGRDGAAQSDHRAGHRRRASAVLRAVRDPGRLVRPRRRVRDRASPTTSTSTRSSSARPGRSCDERVGTQDRSRTPLLPAVGGSARSRAAPRWLRPHGPCAGGGAEQAARTDRERTAEAGSLEVSSVGLGVQNMSRTYQTTIPNRPEMINIIRTAFDRGVTFFDAAEAYGPHEVERILGEGVAPFRDEVVITSKFGWNIDLETGERRPGLNSKPEHIKRGRRGHAQAPPHRPHRPPVPAPGRSGGADRGRRRCGQGPEAAGKGPALGPVGDGARTRCAALTPRCRSPPSRTSTRCSGADPRRR